MLLQASIARRLFSLALSQSVQMYVLSCLIGPPSGLNLRNILWHGFVSSNEISQEYVSYCISRGYTCGCGWDSVYSDHAPLRIYDSRTNHASIYALVLTLHKLVVLLSYQCSFAYLFFVIVSSLGKVLESAIPSLLPLNHRPFISFPQEVILSKIFPGKYTVHTLNLAAIIMFCMVGMINYTLIQRSRMVI